LLGEGLGRGQERAGERRISTVRIRKDLERCRKEIETKIIYITEGKKYIRKQTGTEYIL
jgi:hypothetical protein